MYEKLWMNQGPAARLLLVLALLVGLCACTGAGIWLAWSAAAPESAEIEAAATSTPLPEPTPLPTIPLTGTLTVHFCDVGQGDAILLQGPDFTLLIDAGRHDRNDVLPYLRSVGVERLDLLVGTHPHADHIGQFPQVLEALPVGEVWLSGDEHTSLTYERALDAILASEAGYHEPRAGEVFLFGSARVEVLHPERLTGRLHDGSISLRIVFGEVAILLTGDAEASAESEMIARGYPLRSQVFKLGHHGSSTSNSAPFLAAVSPEVAIYSAGLGNSYGHPHAEVIERLGAARIPVYGTDRYGAIRVITDGRQIVIETERGRADTLPGEGLAAGGQTR
jgi:beta-lactamase superfamily II metal-dependent hydrolase